MPLHIRIRTICLLTGKPGEALFPNELTEEIIPSAVRRTQRPSRPICIGTSCERIGAYLQADLNAQMVSYRANVVSEWDGRVGGRRAQE
jgi:hypothetical protein